MDKLSAAYIMREIQIKAIRHHYTSMRMVKIQNTDDKNWQRCKGTEILIPCWWEYITEQFAFRKTVGQFFIILNILLPNDQTTVLGNFPKKLKIMYTDVYNSFIHDKTWKQRRCPLVDE